MPRCALLAAGAFLAPAAFAQPRLVVADAPLDLVRFRTAQTVAALPRGDARCTAPLPSGVRACLSDTPGPSHSYVFTLETGSERLARVTSDYYRPSDVPAFDLVQFDSGEGPLYTLLERVEEDADRPAASRWKAFVWDDAFDETPLRFVLAEHTGAASFPTVGGRRMFRVTSWEGDADRAGATGLHLVGRTYRYDSGALVPEGPTLRRPWTDALAAERRAAFAAGQHLWDWTATATLRLAHDPRTAPLRPRTTTPGRLGAVSTRDDDGQPQVAFHPDAPSPPSFVPVFDLADGPSGQLFPEGYAPRGGWAAYLVGKRARLVTYVVPPSWTDANALLWLER